MESFQVRLQIGGRVVRLTVDATEGVMVLEEESDQAPGPVVIELLRLLDILSGVSHPELPERHGQPWTDEDLTQLVELNDEGWTTEQIAEHLGRTPNAIEFQLDGLASKEARAHGSGGAEDTGSEYEDSGAVLQDSEPCPHGLPILTCALCSPSWFPKWVYIAAGGQVFHAERECSALLRGQEKVEARGGDISKIERWMVGRAIAEGRRPCRRCLPARDRR